MPAVIMLLIGSIKGLIDVREFEEYIPAADVPVVPYEIIHNITTSYPNVLCYDNNPFYRYILWTQCIITLDRYIYRYATGLSAFELFYATPGRTVK